VEQTTEKLSRETLEKNYMVGSTIRDGLRDVLDRESGRLAKIMDRWFASGVEHLHLVGCGGSRAVLEPAKWLMDKFSGVPVDAYTGWEFVTRNPYRLNLRTPVVVGSHSGTTEEILASVEVAHCKDAPTLSFSRAGTLLSEAASDALTYSSPATNLSKLLMNYMVAVEMIERSGDAGAARELRAALDNLPEVLHEVKEQTDEMGKQLAAKYHDRKGFYLVAAGPLSGLAYQFATCNLLEMQWKHASVYNAGEWAHGPLEIVDDGVPFIFLLGNDETRPVTERALKFTQRHGGDCVVLDLADFPNLHPWIAPFALHMPLEWWLLYMGVLNEHPIATRRYMGLVEY